MPYISAVLVTKGDVDLTPILQTLPFDDVVIHDNSKDRDYKVYGRYMAMNRAKHDIIYTQDDDAVTDPIVICQHYKHGFVTANMPLDRRSFYSDGIALIGWGSVFDRYATEAMKPYFDRFTFDDLFMRECDRVFTALNTVNLIDVPFTNLPNATAVDRMGQEQRHLQDLATIRERIIKIKWKS